MVCERSTGARLIGAWASSQWQVDVPSSRIASSVEWNDQAYPEGWSSMRSTPKTSAIRTSEPGTGVSKP